MFRHARTHSTPAHTPSAIDSQNLPGRKPRGIAHEIDCGGITIIDKAYTATVEWLLGFDEAQYGIVVCGACSHRCFDQPGGEHIATDVLGGIVRSD